MDATYRAFLESKAPRSAETGVDDVTISDRLFPFQADATRFALRRGRAGLFLSTGLGKTICELEWCTHALKAANGKALLLTPLAVAWQIEAEAKRFGYDARVIRDQSDARDGINICNYDRLDKLDPDEFSVVALDESSAIKAAYGKTTALLTEAFASHRFKLSATATPAPNDHMELGTQAEFLSIMSYQEMLSRWFINDTSTASQSWRLKGHAVSDFWDWVASWARVAALPSDLGYSDDGFILPRMHVHRHKVGGVNVKAREGELFAISSSATGIYDVKRQTAGARADAAAALVNADREAWVVWCDTDKEADELLARIPDAVEVRGSHSIEKKEERIRAFVSGEARVIISKPSMLGWGLNFQHCANMVFVGRTFSFEAYFQAVRRCWRFGQKREVNVHLVIAEGEDAIGRVLARKEADHAAMRAAMSAAMRRAMGRAANVKTAYVPTHSGRLPTWLAK